MPYSDPEAYREYQRNYQRVYKQLPQVKKRNQEVFKAYYEANKAEILAGHRNWNEENSDHRREYDRARYQADPEAKHVRNRKRRAAKASVPSTPYTRLDILDLYGATCYLCGVHLPRERWHIEHVIPLSRGGWDMISNVRPSCAPCNLRKNTQMPPTIQQAQVWYGLSSHIEMGVLWRRSRKSARPWPPTSRTSPG